MFNYEQTTMHLMEHHNHHIQDEFMPFIMDVLEELGCGSCKFESAVLPDPLRYSNIREYLRKLNEDWQCTLTVNGYFAFHYRLSYNFGDALEITYKIQAMDDKRYFVFDDIFQEAHNWPDTKEAIRLRLHRLIQITLPMIENTASIVKDVLNLKKIYYKSHNHEGIYFNCIAGNNIFDIKVNDIGDILRLEASEKHFKIGQLREYYVFSPERMRKMIQQNTFLQFIYNDLLGKYKGIKDGEYRVFELVFNSYVLEDFLLKSIYSEM